jgi:hypothetical protein
MWQRRFVLEHLSKFAAINPPAAVRTADAPTPEQRAEVLCFGFTHLNPRFSGVSHRTALGAPQPTRRLSLPRTSLQGLDRSDREIDSGYRCVTARRSIVLIGQSDFSDAGCSKDRRNDLACNALVPGTHSHHSDEVHFECKSSIRIPSRSERNPRKECETLTLRSLALKLFRTPGARHS